MARGYPGRLVPGFLPQSKQPYQINFYLIVLHVTSHTQPLRVFAHAPMSLDAFACQRR